MNVDKHRLKIIFMGTPEIATVILSGLLSGGYPIYSVVTRMDKAKGRSDEPQRSFESMSVVLACHNGKPKSMPSTPVRIIDQDPAL